MSNFYLNEFIMRPDNREKIAMGMLLSTAGTGERRVPSDMAERLNYDIEDVRRALEPYMTSNFVDWSGYRYDLIVGIDSKNQLKLFPLHSKSPVKGMLLSEVGSNPNIDRRIFWLLSAPMYKTSANTVRAIYGIGAEGAFQLTEPAYWGAMTNAYLEDTVKYFDSYNISQDYWEKYKHTVLTGDAGESNSQVDIMKSGSLVDGGPLDRGPVEQKSTGGGSLLEIANNIQ